MTSPHQSFRLAYLILAHQYPDMVGPLMDSLTCEGVEFYLHIDAKSSMFEPLFKTYQHAKNVHFVKRHAIYWGHHSMIEAMLSLLQAAHQDGCDYMVLISGQDLPLKSATTLKLFYEAHKEVVFLNHQPLPVSYWEGGGVDRLDHYWFVRYRVKGLRFKLYNVLWGYPMTYLSKRLKYRKQGPIKTFYAGAQWFNLNDQAVNAILGYLEENPKALNQFKHTLIPDEVFIQTVLAASGYQGVLHTSSLRYVDWRSGPEYPKTLRQEDYDVLTQSDALFARKFDPNVDAAIIERIKVYASKQESFIKL